MDSFLISKEVSANIATRMLMKGTSRLMTGAVTMQQFEQSFFTNISRVMFFLLPFFAFMIWLFFKNSAPYYISHLIFALHFHSAVFLIFTAWLFLLYFIGDYGNEGIPLLVCLVYLFLSLRTVYGETRLVTGIKMFSATVVYLVMVLVGMSIAALVSIASF